VDAAGARARGLGSGSKRRSVPAGRQALQALTEWLAVRDEFIKPGAVSGH
jgi:integrase/recombinase XerC